MNIKLRLTILSFLQLFIWGAWLITIGNYWFETQSWGAEEFGLVFTTLGIGSLVMSPVLGIVADKWIRPEIVYSISHLISGAAIVYLTQVDDPNTFFWVMLIAMLFYMPTIALSNSISYAHLTHNNLDVVKSFPPIRVWGTIGFIVAMWVTNLTGNKASETMFVISSVSSLALAIYTFTLPKIDLITTAKANKTIAEFFGLDAFKLFKNYRMAVFFIFSMFLGGALQLTNMYGDVFLNEFKNMAEYKDSIMVERSTIIMSISQISETLFILTIPFFLQRFGIKTVMLISMGAWVFRFLLFSYGNPGEFLWMIILSNIIYGMAFDFFNISGSLFLETETPQKLRSSSQGLFMMMTNGLGAILGSLVSGYVIENFFTYNGSRDWPSIWMSFAIYALVIAVLFFFLFKEGKNSNTFSAKSLAH